MLPSNEHYLIYSDASWFATNKEISLLGFFCFFFLKLLIDYMTSICGIIQSFIVSNYYHNFAMGHITLLKES